MIAANQAVARLLAERGVPTLYRVHERPDPVAVDRLLAQLASLDVPTPPAPERMTRHAGRRDRRAGFAARRRARSAHRARAHGAHVPRAALAPAGALHAAEPRARRPRADALLPLHLADPPLPRPDLPPRAAVGRRRRRGRRRSRAALEEGGIWCSAREREAMAIERDADNVAQLLPARARPVRGGLGRGRVRRRGHRARRQRRVRALRRAGRRPGTYEGFLPVRRISGELVGAQRGGHDPARARQGGAMRIGDPVRVRVERVETARGRVDLLPGAGDAESRRLSFAGWRGAWDNHAECAGFPVLILALALLAVLASCAGERAVRQAVPAGGAALGPVRRGRAVHARAGDRRRGRRRHGPPGGRHVRRSRRRSRLTAGGLAVEGDPAAAPPLLQWTGSAGRERRSYLSAAGQTLRHLRVEGGVEQRRRRSCARTARSATRRSTAWRSATPAAARRVAVRASAIRDSVVVVDRRRPASPRSPRARSPAAR